MTTEFQDSTPDVTPHETESKPPGAVEKRAAPDWWAPVGPAVWADQPATDYVLRQDNADPNEQQGTAFLPAGKVCMVASPGGYGKSMLLAYVAVSVATGVLVFGLRPTKPGRVLLCPAEDDRAEVIRRIQKAAKGLSLSHMHKDMLARNLYLHTADGAVRLADMVKVRQKIEDGTTERHIERVEAAHTQLFHDLKARLDDTPPKGQEWPADANSTPWRLVVLDPLSRWGGLDNENDNAAATRAVEVIEALTRTKDAPAVLVAHHEGKRQDLSAGASAIRGASALVDGMRWASRLARYAADDAADPVRYLGWVIVKSNYTACDLVVWIEQDKTDGSLTGTVWDRVNAAIEKEKATKAKAEAEAEERKRAAKDAVKKEAEEAARTKDNSQPIPPVAPATGGPDASDF